MGEPAAFILSTGASGPNAVQPMWYGVGGLAVTRISATPWNDLAAPPGGAFVWDPAAARCAIDCGIMSVGLPPHRQAPVHVCRLSPAPERGAIIRFLP